MVMLASLIAFGATAQTIKPEYRFYQDGDTFTVFRISAERIIAYKLSTGGRAKKQVVNLKKQIRNFASEINFKDSINSSLVKELASCDSFVNLHDANLKVLDNKIKRLARQIKWLKVQKRLLVLVVVLEAGIIIFQYIAP